MFIVLIFFLFVLIFLLHLYNKNIKMDKIILKTGETIEFNPLVYNDKCLSKVRLTNNDDDAEGIWIVVSEQDKKDLAEDKQSGYFVAMLANDALNFNFPSWGMHIVCKHNGTERPLADITWVDYYKGDNQIFSVDCQK
jgi:hypothetical protein